MLIFPVLLSFFLLPASITGKTEWGWKKFSKYEPGNTSIIITCPHDGKLNPSKQDNGDPWPDRKPGCLGSDGRCIWKHNCGKTDRKKCAAVTITDENASILARDIANGIRTLTGLRPHVVYNRLKRTKIEVNRDIDKGTLNVPDARKAWRDYHKFVEKARSAIHGRGMLLDIHGQVHDKGRIELGYFISGSQLNNDDFTADNTSIRNLGKQWCGDDPSCFKMFVHGHRSLGYFLNQEGLRVVPSPQDPAPNNTVYLYGKYTVQNHGSRCGGLIDAIQMEFPLSLSSKSGWKRVKHRVVRAIFEFLKLNYGFPQKEAVSSTDRASQ